MNKLTPSQAANIANLVYRIEQNLDETKKNILISDVQEAGLSEIYSAESGSRLKGSSGALLFKSETGFAYLAEGKGRFAGELIFAFRGTNKKNYYDIATDLNCGLQRGPSGTFVHIGFNETYKSMVPKLQAFLKGRNPSLIHCVGHSLGGGLASLVADQLSEQKVAKVQLYTFGSPRVGTPHFSKHLSRKLGAENIYRVYHSADPVSMIPLFPFCHLPFKGRVLELPFPGKIATAAHDMNNYINSVEGRSWAALATPSEPLETEAHIKSWLTSSVFYGPALMSGALLQMIGKALVWIVGQIVGNGLSAALCAGSTALDVLSHLLSTGYKTSKEIAWYVTALVRKIFAFLGRTVQAGVDITQAFLRWTLSLLFNAVSMAARQALRAL